MGNSWFLHELICIHDGSWWNVRMNGEFTDTLNILEPNFDRHITHHDHHDRVVLTEAHVFRGYPMEVDKHIVYAFNNVSTKCIFNVCIQ